MLISEETMINMAVRISIDSISHSKTFTEMISILKTYSVCSLVVLEEEAALK